MKVVNSIYEAPRPIRWIAPAKSRAIIANHARLCREFVLQERPTEAGPGDTGFEDHGRPLSPLQDVEAVSVYGDQAAGWRESLVVTPFACKLVEETQEQEANQDRGKDGVYKHEENPSV
jgi:hypothetical protein